MRGDCNTIDPISMNYFPFLENIEGQSISIIILVMLIHKKVSKYKSKFLAKQRGLSC